MKTLLLDTDEWDLVLDAHGNIAAATNPYAIAQDVSSAVRLFLGELYYDTTKGVPHFQEILGKNPPISLIKSEVVKAALTVPEVTSATCLIAGFSGRTINGQVQVTDTTGETTLVNF